MRQEDGDLEIGGLSLDSPRDDGFTRLDRSQGIINLNRLRVGVIPLTLSLINFETESLSVESLDSRSSNQISPRRISLGSLSLLDADYYGLADHNPWMIP